jgi:hypothetical protein
MQDKIRKETQSKINNQIILHNKIQSEIFPQITNYMMSLKIKI